MKPAKKYQSVLILDDDTIQARVLSRKLLSLGYDIAAVTFTGAEAIVFAKKKQPDIVLLDINLNGQATNGIEVGRAIRKIYKDSIIIYITAYASDENFTQALASMPSAFISKPYDLRTLDRQISLAINQVLEKNKTISQPCTETTTIPTDYRVLCFPNHLKIKEKTGYKDWLIQDLQYLEANGAYTVFQGMDQKTIMSIGIGKLEEKLLAYPYPRMARIHHKFLINMEHIKALNVTPKSGGILSMADGGRLTVSRGYAQDFWKRYLRYNSHILNS